MSMLLRYDNDLADKHYFISIKDDGPVIVSAYNNKSVPIVNLQEQIWTVNFLRSKSMLLLPQIVESILEARGDFRQMQKNLCAL